VLPSSVAFLLAYAWGTQRFSRERLFNVIVAAFLAFYVAFGLAYPHHEALHLAAWADALAGAVPPGLGGLVGMARNWLFTAFYCVSELWGDVVLSLLFWGLANETTSIEDAPLLYPLFGVGANVAQTLAGRTLRVFSDAAGVHLSYTAQLQATVGLCVVMGVAVVALHRHISATFPRNPKGSTARRVAAERAAAAAAAAAGGAVRHVKLDLEASVRGLNYCDVEGRPAAAAAAAAAPSGAAPAASNGAAAAAALDPPPQQQPAAPAPRGAKAKSKAHKPPMGVADAFAFLRRSPQIRCLAVMALAQGITTRLLEVSWKHYLHRLHATPAAYAAFLGDTAMWTGIVTGSLMFTSPMLFDRIGWRGVASVTPTFMLWGGVPFFAGCIAFNALGASPAATAGGVALPALVLAGAVLQVFSRGAKFSLFKPAEEMVYIGLDDESRTKGALLVVLSLSRRMWLWAWAWLWLFRPAAAPGRRQPARPPPLVRRPRLCTGSPACLLRPPPPPFPPFPLQARPPSTWWAPSRASR
jgi:AAA family ATP:ADP antiporter